MCMCRAAVLLLPKQRHRFGSGIYMCVCIYILEEAALQNCPVNELREGLPGYIYIEREREREREPGPSLHTNVRPDRSADEPAGSRRPRGSRA